MLIGTTTFSRAQSTEIQQLLLNYEKLNQLKNILSDMKKGYKIVSKGYTAIKDISQGNFNLHEAFIDGLMAVNPAIKNYKRVVDIISYQKNIVREYKSAFIRFKQNGSFSPDEIEYLGEIYGQLFNKSIQNLDELATVITSSKLSMSDDERLQAIDRIFADTEDKLQFLRDFNKQANLLAIQRSREKQDVATMQQLYQGNQ
ncbi:hypothetical protein SAMN05421813_13133 [Daejeonella rubra]|uniref:TerB family tellurite resistance protein n=2 Tax=Daejeonella rubra TaxID=990371 RepID=A0A1G9XLR7_9SPHI|nr:hypothetical protein SAMN05421813_13133 [Daejeonella rubra]